jgi:wyosine [tRNA(Phe)-imidazoG37] synthetase (radical SAM superfamily)
MTTTASRYIEAAGSSPSYVFGPVPSRRLGRSLGVDLVPFKTCTFNCIYCQLGRTTCKTVVRKDWVPVHAVLQELRSKLSSKPDYITLSGSGEPTLHVGIGELIKQIRAMTSIPIAVLTNGSLLWQKEVRDGLAGVDVVLPSLDAPDAEQCKFINRPHPDISFERLLDGLEHFRREFSGQYWLEVMLLDGYTARPVPVRQIAAHVRHIRPDKIQLNTAVRPPAEGFALAAPRERLVELAGLFDSPVEIIAEHLQEGAQSAGRPSAHAVLTMLCRRPCTIEDVARGLAVRPARAAEVLADLESQGHVRRCRRGSEFFYQPRFKRTKGKP